MTLKLIFSNSCVVTIRSAILAPMWLKMFLVIKADFLLRSRSSAGSASVSHFDAAPNDNLVPKLVLNNTHGVSPIPPDVVETDVDDTGDTAFFPCTILYLMLQGKIAVSPVHR